MQQQAFDLTQSTPRVNAGLMGRFVGQRVKLVGQVASVNGSNLTLKTADEATVTVILAGDPPADQFLEVEGTVESPNTVKEESHTGFGTSFGECRRRTLASRASSCCSEVSEPNKQSKKEHMMPI